MNAQVPATETKADRQGVGLRARRRVACRLLPFVFLLYIINYIDRVNVSFANLRMSADLGFSDRVYGLGVGMFYVTYVLFEIPGAIIVERWSARKWIARIMISWGIVTILTGFVHTTAQFYAARFLLGVAESSFFPGMIVYLTHWFCARDRSKAVACLYTATPAATLIGAPLAGWLLRVHWQSLAGWRWLFILEGLPAVAVGIITYFYMTDRPAQARWLAQDERDTRQRIARRTRSEKEASKLHDHPSVLRPANSHSDYGVLPRAHWCARNHLLDTNLREAALRRFESDRDVAFAGSGLSGLCRAAFQWLALRQNC